MASSVVDICNQALSHLGLSPIVALTDNTDRARLCNQFYAKARDFVLKSHPWNFATQRVTLKAFREPASSLTLSAVSGTISITAATTVFTSADVGREIVGTAGGKATVTAFTSGVLVSATVTTTFPSTAVASGQWKIYNVPPTHTFAFTLSLPSGVLRILPPDDEPWEGHDRYKVERDPTMGVKVVVANVETLEVRQIMAVTTTTEFEPFFEEALSLYLAHKIAFPATGKLDASKAMYELFKLAMQEGRSLDAQEDTGDETGTNILGIVRQTQGDFFDRSQNRISP